MAREMTVVPYDPAWQQWFVNVRTSLQAVFGDRADIHHFGSTAIAGMCAKPTLDVMVVLQNIGQADALVPAMEALGYGARGENGIPGRRYFVKLAADGETHLEHIHVYEPDNPHVADELLFRDFVAKDRAAFEAYAAVKRQAAGEHRLNPGGYVDAKTACVLEIMQRARAAQE